MFKHVTSFLAVLFLTASGTVFIHCGQGNSGSEGDFCDGDDACQGDLVCEQNVCVKPEINPCDPPCNDDVEICYRGECVIVANADDKDADESPVGEDCDDYNRTIHPGAFEYCDGVDNNCDGQTDEDCPACEEGQLRDCGTDVGECGPGTQTCNSGIWQACSGQVPVPEKCDDLDNDCDGQTDENCPCEDGDQKDCGSGVGECTAGVEICDGEVWPGCLNGQLPSSELCNGLDDDCDSLTDEGFGLGADCGSPGKCGNGRIECFGDLETGCSSGPGGSADGSSTELCNGLDDDCDSETDEDFPAKGETCDGDDSDMCKNGTSTCKADGSALECVNESVEDIAEACNGLDDDCDSETDEDFAVGEACQGEGACGQGTIECADENTTRCSTDPGGSQYLQADEVCDGQDNDCDGLTDAADGDLVLTSCELQQGICAGSTHEASQCVAGQWQVCNAANYPQGYGAEVCDGLDNDCNAQADAADAGLLPQLCENQNGVCAGSTKLAIQCVAGEWEACTAASYQAHSQYFSTDELCDEYDNDCDTLNNEGLDTDVDGDGHFTTNSCSDPSDDCNDNDSNNFPTNPEVCDGADNNCDTRVDEGFNIDGDAYTTCAGDCDDSNSSIYPGAAEICNGRDDDCDSKTDAADSGLQTILCGEQNGVCHGAHYMTSECQSGTWEENCSEADFLANSSEYIRPDLPPSYSCSDPNGHGEGLYTADCDSLDNDCDGRIDDPVDCDNDSHYVCNQVNHGQVDDCCDRDPWTFTGQVNYYDDPVNGCGGYDYNCDGVETKDPQLDVLAECRSVPDCAIVHAGYFNAIPACGVAGTWSTICVEFAGQCIPSAFTGSITMRCR
ncbi:MAG TPA: putative metal-binding motif-containing protein [Myxococcota bacterium]|nr:putative metal-binding motif-containing protein [Myxococcota bacterium]